MSFERKIAEQGLEKVEGPKIEPGKETQGGTLEVRGGAIAPRDRGHKNWGEVINQGFELRSLLTTMEYLEAGSAAPLNVGNFGYYAIRAQSRELTISVDRGKAVPEDQHTSNGDHRYRQRWMFVEIFYPAPTKLSFHGCIYGRSGYRLEGGETVEVPEGEVPPPPTPVTLVPMSLAEELGDGSIPPAELDNYLRKAGTADFFLISHNERTGANFVAPLVLGIENAVDPEDPIDDPDDDNDDEDENEPKEPGDGDNDYTDPDTGENLVVTPPPPGRGQLIALHDGGLSQSTNAGATWLYRDVPGVGNVIDIAASPAGIFLLTSEGRVYHMLSFDCAANELNLADFMPEGGVEIPIANGDFEKGNLDGWTLVEGDTPRVLNSAQPPQRTGSEYYLTRDWRVINPQNFTIEQTVEVIPEAEKANRLRLSFDARTENGDIATVEVFDATAAATVKDDFPIVFSGSEYRATGFATDESGAPLDLVGTVLEVSSGDLTQLPSSAPFYGIEANSSAGGISFAIRWNVLTADGLPWGGLVTLRIADLDRGGDFEEVLRAEGLVAYDLLVSTVQATPIGDGVVEFVGPPDTPYGDTPNTRFLVSFRSECVFRFTSTERLVVGVRGPGNESQPPESLPILIASHDGDEWATIKAEYAGPVPPRLRIEVSGSMVGGYADVYIDNVKLSTVSNTDDTGASAIAAIPGKNGGADIYVGDVLIPYIPSALTDEKAKPQPHFAPEDGVDLAAHGTRADQPLRIAANGADVWVQVETGGDWYADPINIPGPFSSVLCDPVSLVLRRNGQLFSPSGVGAGSVAADSTLSGDRRRIVAVSTGPDGTMHAIPQSHTQTEYKKQPVNASIADRRTAPMDIGRYIGWGVGVREFFWNDTPASAWKLGGALERSIKKIVEVR